MPLINAISKCTRDNTSETKDLKAIDTGWTLLGEQAVKDFFDGPGRKLYHQGLAEHRDKHVCARYSTWAFDAADGTEVRGVVFLRYEFKGGLRKSKPNDTDRVAESLAEGVHFIFGHDVYKDYKKLKFLKQQSAHVWQRDAHGEIAVDFCVD